MIQIKRAYDPASDEDGRRILVDRLWPRGISKEKAKLDSWAKEISPSDVLRKRFHHDPEKWAEFKSLYEAELENCRGALQLIADEAKKETVTLVFGARDVEHNQAVVLKQVIESLMV